MGVSFLQKRPGQGVKAGMAGTARVRDTARLRDDPARGLLSGVPFLRKSASLRGGGKHRRTLFWFDSPWDFSPGTVRIDSKTFSSPPPSPQPNSIATQYCGPDHRRINATTEGELPPAPVNIFEGWARRPSLVTFFRHCCFGYDSTSFFLQFRIGVFD